MNKEALLSIAERDFILNALREDVRLDGRGLDQLRPLKVSFGEEYGHVKVQLGKTTYVLPAFPREKKYSNLAVKFDYSRFVRSDKTPR